MIAHSLSLKTQFNCILVYTFFVFQRCTMIANWRGSIVVWSHNHAKNQKVSKESWNWEQLGEKPTAYVNVLIFLHLGSRIRDPNAGTTCSSHFRVCRDNQLLIATSPHPPDYLRHQPIPWTLSHQTLQPTCLLYTYLQGTPNLKLTNMSFLASRQYSASDCSPHPERETSPLYLGSSYTCFHGRTEYSGEDGRMKIPFGDAWDVS